MRAAALVILTGQAAGTRSRRGASQLPAAGRAKGLVGMARTSPSSFIACSAMTTALTELKQQRNSGGKTTN